jgi:amino acid permease
MGAGGEPLLSPALPGGAPPAPYPTWRLVVTIVKSFIGSGVLFLPKAFSNGGYAFSTASFLACAVLTNVCVTKLIACRAAMPPGSDYGAIGARVAGRWGAAAVNAALVLSQAGFCCVYISFIARNLIQLFNDGPGGCWVAPGALWLFVACEFLVLAPLTWVRRLSSFAPTNLAANLLILTGIAGVLAFSVGGIAGSSGGGGGDGGGARGFAALPAIAPRWPLMLGTAVYAFEGAGMVVPLVNELPPADRARFPRVFALTLAGVSALYLVVGLLPYLYLVGYARAEVQDTITLNLPHVWWSYCLTAGYCLALAFSYPLMLFPAVRVLEEAAAPYLFAGQGGGALAALQAASDAASAAAEAEGGDGGDGAAGEGGALLGAAAAAAAEELADEALRRDTGWGMWKTNLFRSGVVAATLLVSYAGSSQLDNMVSIIGAFCCTPMCVRPLGRAALSARHSLTI